MPEIIPFYIVFLSQIFILSVYYPLKITNRMKTVVHKFPPSDYPKLYPNQTGNNIADNVLKGISRLKAISILIALIGAGLLIASIITGKVLNKNGLGSEDILALYAILQFSPFIYLEISELKYYKKMRELNTEKTRSADLTPRRFFDFVSPSIFAVAVLLVILTILVDLIFNDFKITIDSSVFIKAMTLLVVHLLFATIIIWHMYIKKLNPHQSAKDRNAFLSTTIKCLVYSSIAISIFLTVDTVIERYNLDVIDAPVMSLYFQLCAIIGPGYMLRTLKVEDMDFSVYKNIEA